MTTTKTATRRKTREGFGRIRKLPSGRHQAAYLGPDGRLHDATATFDGLLEARGWLTDERRMIDAGTWTPPESRNAVRRLETLRPYADAWLVDRTLKPRTRSLYRGLLDSHILPELGGLPLRSITPAVVRSWYAEMGTAHPTRRAHAYGLLRTILGSAVADGKLAANPCHIRGAGSSKRGPRIPPGLPG